MTQRLALIADDSRIQAKILEYNLLRAGFRVHTALDGAQGLELALQEKPHIIISDIEMPKMSGYEFCRAVKNSPQLRDVPVILLSTLSEAEDIFKGLESGADNYVTKPYDPQYLLGRVESLLLSPLELEREEKLELAVTLGGKEYLFLFPRQGWRGSLGTGWHRGIHRAVLDQLKGERDARWLLVFRAATSAVRRCRSP